MCLLFESAIFFWYLNILLLVFMLRVHCLITFYCIHISQFLLSPVAGHVDYVSLWVTLYETAMNILIQIFLQTLYLCSLGRYAGLELRSHSIHTCSTLWETNSFVKYHFTSLTVVYIWKFRLFHIPANI